MTSVNHIVGGTVITAIFASFADINVFSSPATIATTITFSVLPDIDLPKSLPGRLFPPLSRVINRKFGHRTITHSLLFLVGAVAMVAFTETIIARPDKSFAIITGIALFGHLILDAITKQGVPLLYPFSRRPCVLPATPEIRLTSGNIKTEATAVVLFVLLGLTCKDLIANGFFLQLNRTLATRQQLVDEFKRTDEILLVNYSFRRNFEELIGTGYCLSAKESEIILFNTTTKVFEKIITDDVVKSLVPSRSGFSTLSQFSITESFTASASELNKRIENKRIVSISLHSQNPIEIIANNANETTTSFSGEFLNSLHVAEKGSGAELKMKQLELAELNKSEAKAKNEYLAAQEKISQLNKRYASVNDYEKIQIQSALNDLYKVEKPLKNVFLRKKIQLSIENLRSQQNSPIFCRVTFMR